MEPDEPDARGGARGTEPRPPRRAGRTMPWGQRVRTDEVDVASLAAGGGGPGRAAADVTVRCIARMGAGTGPASGLACG